MGSSLVLFDLLMQRSMPFISGILISLTTRSGDGQCFLPALFPVARFQDGKVLPQIVFKVKNENLRCPPTSNSIFFSSFVGIRWQ